jgi:hypothetical protein
MSIHRPLAGILACLLALFGMNATLAAPAGGVSSSPRFNPPGHVYLALGDSLAFG